VGLNSAANICGFRVAVTLDANVGDITKETRSFQETLLQCVKRISDGQGDIQDLKNDFAQAIEESRTSIDDILDVAMNLRSTMLSIQHGMDTLLDGAKSSISGSAKNIEYSSLITDEAQQIMNKVDHFEFI